MYNFDSQITVFFSNNNSQPISTFKIFYKLYKLTVYRYFSHMKKRTTFISIEEIFVFVSRSCCGTILSVSYRVYIKDGNLRTQPKFIVFLSKLLLLFKSCHSCKTDNPLVKTEQVGTMVVITSSCTNKKCKKKDIIWRVSH